VSESSMTQIDVHNDACRGCEACGLACSAWHHGECSLALACLLVTKDMARYEFAIRICQHCEAAACLEACSAGAMEVDDRGVVRIDHTTCTRCGSCAAACPHEAIFFNDAKDLYLKCDLCAGRSSGPLCVEVCPVAALTLKEALTRG
jgi:Fe-S-cluster-containing dehydrogenase component